MIFTNQSFNGNCFNKLKSNNKIRDIEMFKVRFPSSKINYIEFYRWFLIYWLILIHHFYEQTRQKVWDVSLGLCKTVSILKVWNLPIVNKNTRSSNPECFFANTTTNGNYLLEIDVHECSNEMTLTEDYLIQYTAHISKSIFTSWRSSVKIEVHVSSRDRFLPRAESLFL